MDLPRLCIVMTAKDSRSHSIYLPKIGIKIAKTTNRLTRLAPIVMAARAKFINENAEMEDGGRQSSRWPPSGGVSGLKNAHFKVLLFLPPPPPLNDPANSFLFLLFDFFFEFFFRF